MVALSFFFFSPSFFSLLARFLLPPPLESGSSVGRHPLALTFPLRDHSLSLL